MVEPNGRVSNAQLYKAITDLERHIDNRIDGLERSVNDRCSGIDERISAHEKSDHGERGSISAKTPTTIASIVAVVVATVAAVLAEVFRR